MTTGPLPDDLAIALGWTRRLLDDNRAAEDCAVEAVRRLRTGELPAWLRKRDSLFQLRVAVIVAVLRQQR